MSLRHADWCWLDQLANELLGPDAPAVLCREHEQLARLLEQLAQTLDRCATATACAHAAPRAGPFLSVLAQSRAALAHPRVGTLLIRCLTRYTGYDTPAQPDPLDARGWCRGQLRAMAHTAWSNTSRSDRWSGDAAALMVAQACGSSERRLASATVQETARLMGVLLARLDRDADLLPPTVQDAMWQRLRIHCTLLVEIPEAQPWIERLLLHYACARSSHTCATSGVSARLVALLCVERPSLFYRLPCRLQDRLHAQYPNLLRDQASRQPVYAFLIVYPSDHRASSSPWSRLLTVLWELESLTPLVSTPPRAAQTLLHTLELVHRSGTGPWPATTLPHTADDDAPIDDAADTDCLSWPQDGDAPMDVDAACEGAAAAVGDGSEHKSMTNRHDLSVVLWLVLGAWPGWRARMCAADSTATAVLKHLRSQPVNTAAAHEQDYASTSGSEPDAEACAWMRLIVWSLLPKGRSPSVATSMDRRMRDALRFLCETAYESDLLLSPAHVDTAMTWARQALAEPGLLECLLTWCDVIATCAIASALSSCVAARSASVHPFLCLLSQSASAFGPQQRERLLHTALTADRPPAATRSP
ncbi:hypothetical protein THASP1DRAFT_28678 [Thamnocephalis sphaerospora]|uniref:Uncharacterized protein n=1 Tax=Thamnocephalis sphaerospora TaxID=78915 RepID=A0A4P9XTP3_9FUNG|nr:hypothetical protein THASP1DRAFT_28678 [Thamnocephalis sphaerospora]|eukprot:RKP09547.1 hypothetical protein THASP1DRAFT_28678 [Thamnocephalis sphaerospora]